MQVSSIILCVSLTFGVIGVTRPCIQAAQQK